MNDPVVKYLFYSWLRQGLATRITGPSPRTPQRPGLPVILQINDFVTQRIQKDVELFGPGDVVGLDSSLVARTDPKRDIGDFEPNYFPLIEFSEPDFPWRYTPTPAPEENAPSRLKPWICLIVLNEEEFDLHPPKREPPLPPSITVKSQRKSLPDLSQSWAWAHWQLTASADEDPTALESRLPEILRREPERFISRLLCPRRLQPGVLYHAFVVPTFETGRLAGIGSDPATAGIEAPAWDATKDAPIDLPYYVDFDLRFRTGLRGDFEYLVRLLEPRKLDKNSGVGMRDMDCSNPGYSVPGIVRPELPMDDPRRHVLALEGALTTLDAEPTPWNPGDDRAFRDQLMALLNAPEEQLTQQRDNYSIVPPIYGCWHALRQKLPGANRPWLNTLNLDPRRRAVAGFGTLIVQDEQEKLMAEAWRQIGAVNEANELIRQAQLGRASSERILRRHFEKLPRADFIRLTAPVHGRVLTESESDGGRAKVTIKHLLAKSPIPSAVLDPAFRRLARPFSPFRKRQQKDADPNRPDIIERLNEGDVVAAGPIPSPDGAPGMGNISDNHRPPWAVGPIWQWLKRLHWILLLLVVLMYLIIGILLAAGVGIAPSHPLILAASLLLALSALILRRFITPGLIADNVQEGEITPERVRSAPGRSGFGFEPPGSDFSPGPRGEDNEAARVFREFAARVQAFLNPISERQPVDLSAVRTTLIEALRPQKTILARVKQRVPIDRVRSLGRILRGFDRLETIMAAPDFPQPMYEPLRNRSQELLLPGVARIPQNTITMLKTNGPGCVYPYMVVLNHEFARELLWREYPTDQRGSYFRQFWDVSNFVPPPSMLEEIQNEASSELGEEWTILSPQEHETEIARRLRERLKDIPPIHEWGNRDLEEISGRKDEALKEKLVLLIRGQLLNKYPSAVIYASKAYWNEQKRQRWPYFDYEEDHRREPVLRATLPPDITFLGFELDKDEARGPSGEPDPTSQNHGWFFVIEERISEARFGMDAPPANPEEHSFDTWNDLSWADLPDNGLQPSGYVNVSTGPEPLNNPEGYTWDSDAATLARITIQRPMRVAVHATKMLPD